MKVKNKSAVPVLEDKSEEGNTHAGTVVEENDGSEQNRSSQADKLKGSSQGTNEAKPGEDEAKDAGSDSDTDSDSESDSDGEKEEVPGEKETLVEDRSEAVLQEEMSQKPVQSSDGKEEQTPEKEANIDDEGTSERGHDVNVAADDTCKAPVDLKESATANSTEGAAETKPESTEEKVGSSDAAPMADAKQKNGKRKQFSMVVKPKEPAVDTKKKNEKRSAEKSPSMPSAKPTSDASKKEKKDASPAGSKEEKKSTKSEEDGKDKRETKPARARSAFIFFTMENRDKVKEQNEKLSLPEMQKKLSEAWKELNDEQRQRYEGMAAADKIRVDAERKAEKKASKNTNGEDEEKSGSNKGDKGPKKPRAKTAYMIFCTKNRERVQKAASSGASFGELTKALAEEWKSLSPEDKKEYEDLAAVDKKRVAELMAADPALASVGKAKNTTEKGEKKKEKIEKKKDKSADEEQKSKAKPVPKAKAEKKAPARRKRKSADSVDEEDRVEGALNDDMFMEDQESEPEEEDAMDEDAADGEYGELQFILGKTRDGKYVTKRKGMDYTQVEYEQFPAKKSKLNPEQEAELEEKVKQYHMASAAFKKELERRLAEGDGNLDLENVPKGSKLEILTFLGNMREDVFPQKTLPKPDVWMKVPMLGTCQVIQQLIDGERAIAAQTEVSLQKALTRIKELENGASGAIVAEE